MSIHTTAVGRRTFLAITPGLVCAPAVLARHSPSRPSPTDVSGDFPRHSFDEAREVVGRSHFDAEGIEKIVSARPALAKASIDWGFGDWESALGAASHTGRRAIAEILIAHGARPDLFTHAMLGHVDVVRAACESDPRLRSARGPHGFTLAHHARVGGDEAELVREYLAQFPDADTLAQEIAIPDSERERFVGKYAFGSGDNDRLIVSVSSRERIQVDRPGAPTPRELRWQGGGVFTAMGAQSVRIIFEPPEGPASSLVVHDPDPIVRAERL